jgi:hypothetical protein
MRPSDLQVMSTPSMATVGPGTLALNCSLLREVYSLNMGYGRQ